MIRLTHMNSNKKYMTIAMIVGAVLVLVAGEVFMYFTRNKDVVSAPQKSPDSSLGGAQAKRVGPKDVPAVIVGNTRIEAPHWGKDRGLEQNGGYIVAYDVKTSAELWTIKVYDVVYKPGMETDVQDVFIVSMTKDPADENKLRITNENGKEYVVDISTKTVTAVN